ncbi:MAG: DUF6603 domain-containing protein [Methylovulum miyakonense]|uniref:DUF6603 domain-containing protein n=1 Tax=Methylovulum miyakonense TaxID=645578 RepID=UPI003BB7B532
MSTEVELIAGLNLEIGSVPVSLGVGYQTPEGKTIYTFNGCVQDAEIPLSNFIGYVGKQFGVDVQLPPELDIEAWIDYLVCQVIYTKPTQGGTTTELGAAGSFDLIINANHYVFNFYADTILSGNTTGNAYVVGASVNVNLAFASLPLVGDVPGFNELSLTNIGFSYTNVSDKTVAFNIPQVGSSANPLYTRNDPEARNKNTYSIKTDGNKQSFALNKKGFSLTAGLSKSGNASSNFALPMALPATPKPNSQTPPPPFGSGKTSPPATSVHWININKKFGPVDLQKIGLNYSKGEASFGFSAGFSLGGFSLGLEEMSITFPMPLPGMPAGDTVSFDLHGLTMDIKTGGLEIGGAFLKSTAEDGGTAYYGQVIVQVGSIGFKALGGYTPAHTANDPNHAGQKIQIPASFFIYANINVPLGGPPYLYLNGFAGGFGVNDLLKLPTLENLPGYILLPGPNSKAPPQGGSAADTINTVLPQMQEYFIPDPGQYWVAAGVTFSSFQMINAFALVTVSFGVDFQVALLGSCSMNFPTGAPTPIAYVEIDILASFSPSTGLLAVEGIISPASYIFGSFCQITGGFAFYIWFNPPAIANGPKTGDFVVTLGGYHPAFTPPAYYPKVPRLGINFNLGPFHVTGGCYFALTPGMFMAGGSMNATWDLDVIKAWFTIGADFLIAWAPFHYEADVYVNVGCSVNLGLVTLNVSVGADLQLWGPPFGGVAEVDLDVVSFTISFGAAQEQPEPIGWQNFKTMFLPGDTPAQPAPHKALMAMAATAGEAAASTNILKSTVAAGLLGSDVNGFDWILDPDHFSILVSSTLPANTPLWGTGDGTSQPVSNDPGDYNVSPPPVDAAQWPYLTFGDTANQMDDTHIWNPTVNIKPMALNGVTSSMAISLLKMDDQGNYGYITAVSLAPVVLDSSAALWESSTGEKPKVTDPSFLKACLTGFNITPLPRLPNRVNGVLLIQLLYQQGNNYYFSYQAQVIDDDYEVSSTGEGSDTLTVTVSGQHTAELKNTGYVLSSLADTWVSSQRMAIFENLNLLGFSTYGTANLTTFASQTALTDWPEVMMLGESLEA